MSWQFVTASPQRNVQVWQSEDPSQPLLVAVDPAEVGPRGWREADVAVRTIVQGLVATGRLLSYGDLPYLRLRGKWVPLSRAGVVRGILQEALVIAPWEDGGDPDPNTWGALRAASDATLEGRLPDALPDGPHKTADALAGEHARPGIPAAVGLVRHPVVGQTRRPFLLDHVPLRRREGREYPHMRALFSGLGLPPRAHAAVYCFLLGAFHARSLDAEHQRPLLVVDSWQQGRGKTQICEAIQFVVDGREGVFAARPNTEHFTKELVANFRSGRCLVLDNLRDIPEYQNDVTTSGVKVLNVRQLYEAGVFQVIGAMIMVNGVMGSMSLHRDTIARSIRCEIPGRSGPLEIVPDQYAMANRDAIMEEAIRAHENAAGVKVGARSRASGFEEVAVAAYCEVFGELPGRVIGLLEESRRSMEVYVPAVLQHLYDHHPGHFLAPPERKIIDTKSAASTRMHRWVTETVSPAHDGATAFGLRLEKGLWEASA